MGPVEGVPVDRAVSPRELLLEPSACPHATAGQELAKLYARLIMAHERRSAASRKLLSVSVHERLALIYLWDRGAMTMRELAYLIPVTGSAMTHMADRLEQLWYVKRCHDPKDRRRVLIVGTEKSARLQAELSHSMATAMVELGAGMDEAERAVIGRYLERMCEILESTTPEAA